MHAAASFSMGSVRRRSGVAVVVLHIPARSPTLRATAPAEAPRLLLLPPADITRASLNSLNPRLPLKHSQSEGTLDILPLSLRLFCAGKQAFLRTSSL